MDIAPAEAGQQVVDFVSAYDGTRIVGVLATPDSVSSSSSNAVPAVVLLHGYTSPFESGATPLDFNRGVTDEAACELELDDQDRGRLVLKSYYQDLIDFFTARGVAVFLPDSFSGRCLEDVLDRAPPEDTAAHPARRAGDAYASLQYLVTEHDFIDSAKVAVLGLWQGGSAALLAVADVETMDRAPFAPAGYPGASLGYVAPPTRTPDWRFAAAVSISPGTGMHGYLGDAHLDLEGALTQGEGLYGSYAPTLILCGSQHAPCDEAGGLLQYRKLASLALKALATAPAVAFDTESYAGADGGFISPNNDDNPNNAEARTQTYARLESWLLPRIQPAANAAGQLVRQALPAGQHTVSFLSEYDGTEIFGVLAVPEGDAVTIDGRGTRAAVVLLHGSSGLFQVSPLEYHTGSRRTARPSNCAPQIPTSAYDEFAIKLSYQEMVDFLLARGVIVFLPDSYSGRCLEEFQGRVPPNDAYAHPFKRAHDAAQALRYLREDSPVAGMLGRVGVAGYSHGGSSAVLAVADVASMGESPFAPPGYSSSRYGYDTPPGEVAGRRFELGVNFYGGVGLYGYLGTNSVSRSGVTEASGLYGSYAPLYMYGGELDPIYYEPDDDQQEYGKFSSFLFKAAFTRPDVEVSTRVYPEAEHQILNPFQDIEFPGNTAARALIYRSLAAQVVPALQFLP
ncbi:hypothetical protein Hoch_6411 [Haliangium ochraceum DSM 14365]|uniref:Dienelactone hydrolase domain-containing protein n=1 Tax=Haliangium ochraceum (strain DSM 14365 / JCM 11303 / SMP-2) TaxID=502025 RepID=D0LQ71_HALO1|nr:hypothetical protein Hoch_6411 [Haliangium ochraceum DSM 14365]